MEILKRKNHPIAFFLIIVCTLFTSAGQIMQKFGSLKINDNFILTIFNLPLFLGFMFYAVATVLMIMAFKKGELSVLYPIIATSYVWVSLTSSFFFPNDSMNVWKWAGILMILGAVTLLGIGSSVGVKEVKKIKGVKG